MNWSLDAILARLPVVGKLWRRQAPLPTRVPGQGALALPEALADGQALHCASTLAQSAQLDHEMGQRLNQAVARTEDAALAIMHQMRTLSDESMRLSQELSAATAQADVIEQSMQGELVELGKMAQFLQALPARLDKDMAHIRAIADEVRALTDMADTVRAVSMQSHLLSMNAAIEASRAGQSGAAFKVVAGEMRILANDSAQAAQHIGAALERTLALLNSGLALGNEAAQAQFRDIAAAAASVERLRSGLGRSSAQAHERLAVLAEHGAQVAAGTGEIMSQLQYQDIVRQCVERVLDAMDQRNAALDVHNGSANDGAWERRASALAGVLEAYLAREALHGDEAPTTGGASIELF